MQKIQIMNSSKVRFITTVLLFLAGCGLSIITIFHNDRSLTTLVYHHIPQTSEVEHRLNRRKITGSITANDNFLGGIDININANIMDKCETAISSP